MESDQIMKNPPPSLWNDVYHRYSGFDLVNEYIYSKLKNILDQYIKSKDRILEAGCGSGYMVAYFQQKGHLSVGLDLYEEPLRVAREVFGVQHTVRGNIFRMPFEDSSFDIVWNEGVLEHFSIQQSIEAAKEMKRVAKRYVIIDVPNRYNLFVVKKHLMRFLGKWPYGYEESYSRKRLRYLMEQAGLEVMGMHGIYIAPPLVPLLPQRVRSFFLQKISFIEDRYPGFTRLFGFHLLMIGKTNKE